MRDWQADTDSVRSGQHGEVSDAVLLITSGGVRAERGEEPEEPLSLLLTSGSTVVLAKQCLGEEEDVQPGSDSTGVVDVEGVWASVHGVWLS